ncbi:helix-turn-helix domain-containing protein [Sciscionella marina]|uniref:helix-turn-helix domain-containing protein n=1 Tax=Sciscionella marina TaxID=508770 RepID=UPI000A3126EF
MANKHNKKSKLTEKLLHTPKEAADMLSIRESWLRRKAGQRKISCTYVGKHLRFSDADLKSLVNSGEGRQTSRTRRIRR